MSIKHTFTGAPANQAGIAIKGGLSDAWDMLTKQAFHLATLLQEVSVMQSKLSEPQEDLRQLNDRFGHEHISALMRENEHNNISMRTLRKENAALTGS